MDFSPRGLPAWVTVLGRPTGQGVRVGVIGSGYDRDRPDPRVLPGTGFVDPSDDLAMLRTTDDHDRIGYGTVCARLVLRVAPDARVVPIRIYGEGLETSPGTLQAGLLWAMEEKLDVVCIAASCQLPEVLHPLYATCEKCRVAGMILVCGGRPDEERDYPAQFEPVIGVLRERFGSPFEFRYHPELPYEMEAWGEGEAIAPVGEGMVLNRHDYAAPVVAGIVALLRERYPGAPVEHVRALLQGFAM